ncbi:D-alanine--D-alanine ligase family protein [Brachybacterium sp. DNPG3]
MRTTVLLLFGGRSGEHGISCVTAGGILGAIDRERYDVIAVGITREGRWVRVSDDPADWTLADGEAPEVPAEGAEVLLPATRKRPGEQAQLRTVDADGRIVPLAGIDVVLPLLHGPYGEDGTVQGQLEMLDLPYVGNGVLASAICMDKAATKLALQAAGIASADGIVVHEDRWAAEADALRADLEARFPLPWFVKPARAGSSLGVSRVAASDELEQAMKTAFAEDPKVLVEVGVVGREVECGVLQGRDGAAPRTTVPGEVRVGEDLDFYDYEAKYFGKGTVEIDVPAALPAEQLEEVRAVAARAFTALGLEGLSRVDTFVTEDGRVIVNEVNTMPGFTPYSMFPVLWQNMGLDYTALITDLVEQARTRRIGSR